MFTPKILLNTIEEAIEDIRNGKIIIVVDVITLINFF
jgi:3,4-dihydroxy-2-butanone 4-phosphate synthase